MRGSPPRSESRQEQWFHERPRATWPSDAQTLPGLSGLEARLAPNSRRDQWENFRKCVEFSAFRGGVRASFQQPVAEYALPVAGIWPALFARR